MLRLVGVGLLRKEKWFCFAAALFYTATPLFSEMVFTYLKIKNHNIRRHTGRECWAFVSAYGLGCERSEEEQDEFWNELTRCMDGLSTRNCNCVG